MPKKNFPENLKGLSVKDARRIFEFLGKSDASLQKFSEEIDEIEDSENED
ncbi:hypothetical protein SAMN04488515_3588 [Cognatiyoonia koreensis]|uniref:Uncharacterized protein n=1 Tax=Cognatiyoonia koreensis TaxID=364200 RepID=A0A1I0RZX1_9RHOB|nr:hypothetical protein [Cognatiyoonia koreensis]SEW47320.1 hypothetical protein SAMN04488515_3588 [Cognatiyoonia koreensis]